jgi:hypothetical protein
MARIDQESAERQATQQAVDAQRRHDERRSARIDARGLPLIGLGIVMTGIPDGLARWAWVGLIFVVAAALLVIVLALWAFGRWVASRISPPPEPEPGCTPNAIPSGRNQIDPAAWRLHGGQVAWLPQGDGTIILGGPGVTSSASFFARPRFGAA